MTPNIFLELEYSGTHYFGFQIQNKPHSKEISVQGVIERALAKLFGTPIRITYASRTDRGVHAQGQSVNFVVDTTIPFKNIKRALNAYLPKDVRVLKVKRVSDAFHARFQARSKHYRYTLFNRAQGTVFMNHCAWQISDRLDIQAMSKAAAKLVGKHDFGVFAKGAATYKSCVRHVESLTVRKRGSRVTIDIVADGFLRYMVRNITGFLVKVGKGEIAVSHIPGIIKGRRDYVNNPAPAQGLCLMKVRY